MQREKAGERWSDETRRHLCRRLVTCTAAVSLLPVLILPAPVRGQSEDLPVAEREFLQMLELEGEPLLHADRQLFFVDGTPWIRSRCETAFRPAPTGIETEARPLLDTVPVEERCAALGIDYSEFVAERLEAAAVPDDQVMFHEAFENNDFDQVWDAWDDEPEYGDDFWDVVSCNSHFGSNSAWCQGKPISGYLECSVVDRYLSAWMATKQGTSLYGYTDKELSYWIDHDMWHDRGGGTGYSDFVWVYLLWDGPQILVDEHREIWSGWHQSTIDLKNIPVGQIIGKEYVVIPYKPAFRF
ncbi:MAG: hypothetical protein OEM62_13145, partial [Acidobacteriota bacterium]|nr:hypothetical protein [Acidobacteriota bacterium]